MKTTICVVEDRQVHEPALKLLLLSMRANCPAVPVNLFYPEADGGFVTWVRRCPQVCLHMRRPNGHGWEVKPAAMMGLIDQGFEEVIWIDSDIIVTQDVLKVFSGLSADTFAATEDALGGVRDDLNALRARLWGFPVGRILPFVLNSAVLRITRAHCHLMERWREVQGSKTFQEAKRDDWNERPVHLKGDQDVLTALLTSKAFSSIPLYILRRGKHILQFNGVFGYTLFDRMRSLIHGLPPFVHSFAGKPWAEQWPTRESMGLSEYIKEVYLDLSPYTITATRFRHELESETGWMDPHYLPSRILRRVGLGTGNPALVGLPIAVLADLMRTIRWVRKSRHLNPFSSEEPEVVHDTRM